MAKPQKPEQEGFTKTLYTFIQNKSYNSHKQTLNASVNNNI